MKLKDDEDPTLVATKRIPERRGYFTLPEDRDFAHSDFVRQLDGSGYCVVGLIGKDDGTKASQIFDQLVQKNVFGIVNPGNGPFSASIRGYVDRRWKRIYLDLRTWPDFKALAEEAQKSESLIKEKGFHAYLSQRSIEGSKMMLLMFQICHMIVLYHPNHSIDLNYISLFQTLESVRTKLQSSFSDVLKEVPGLSKEWHVYGRLTPPRILFYFATAPMDLRGSRGTAGIVKKDGKISKHPPIRKLEFSIEDQVYRVFRKARLITNSSNNLFNVPGRDGFVYVENGNDSSFGDRTLDSITNLCHLLEHPKDPSEMQGPFTPYFYEEKVQDSRGKRCFSNFLSHHIETIPIRGTDAEGKFGGLELPSVREWLSTVEALLPLFQPKSDFQLQGKSTEISQRASQALLNYNDRDVRFSELRCSKAHPLAFNAYKEGLPQYYTEDYHNAKLLQAMSIFSVQARGPATSKYAEKLAEDCRRFWESGRQMCEEFSLSGNPCKQMRHLAHGEDIEEDSEDEIAEESSLNRSGKKCGWPTMHHDSRVSFVSACNCGKSQSNRPDPFHLIEANWKFYSDCEIDCCQALVHLNFPVCEQKASSKRPGPVISSSALLDLAADPAVSKVDGMDKLEIKEHQDLLAKTNDPLQTLAELAAKTNKGANFGPTHTTESIGHMMTGSTPSNRLPLFPSWSLVQLGSSHLYSHSTGMNQAGFLQGSKSLLPWDIPLKEIEGKVLAEQWPNLAEIAMKRPNFNPNAKVSGLGLTVKAFLGFEYECPRGHRFMASAPDRAMKANPGALREAAGKILSADMPLYMTCPGRIAICLPAQLMRIHVVTPKAPIHVTLMPQVQPCVDGPIFHCGWREAQKLPHNSCWVFRLPFIYCGENGAHLPPQKEVTSIHAGRMIKGVLGISEDFEDMSKNL